MNSNQWKTVGVCGVIFVLSFAFHIYDVSDSGGIMVVTRRYIWEQIGVIAFLGLFVIYFLRTKKKKK